MKKKIIGMLVSILLVATTLSATGATNVQTTQNMKENNDLEPYLNNPVSSPGIITIKIVANVIDVYDPNNLLGGVIQVDDTVTGKYVYDSGTPDSDPDPDVGEYKHTSSTFGMELKVGGLVFKTNPSNVDFLILIANDWIYGDVYGVYSYENLQLSNGMFVSLLAWELIDENSTVFSSDALPTTAPVPSDWELNLLGLNGHDPSNPSKYYKITATVTQATKSRTRDVHSDMQSILTWLFEHFANMFPILRQLMKL
jgi:hypothetical protein